MLNPLQIEENHLTNQNIQQVDLFTVIKEIIAIMIEGTGQEKTIKVSHQKVMKRIGCILEQMFHIDSHEKEALKLI